MNRIKRRWQQFTAPWRLIDELGSEIEALTEQIEEMKADHKELANEVDTIGGKIDDVAEDIERNYASESYVDDEVNRAVTEAVNSLERSIGNVEDEIRKLERALP